MSQIGDLIMLSKTQNSISMTSLPLDILPSYIFFPKDEAFISLAPACPVEVLENLAKKRGFYFLPFLPLEWTFTLEF